MRPDTTDRRRRAARDDGSILIFGIGMLVCIVAFLAVIADIAVLHQQHRNADVTADAAARAGAQALDLERYYRGRGMPLTVDPAIARRLTSQYLHELNAPDGWRLEQMSTTGSSVHVTIAREVRLPFTSLLSDRSATVRASSTAQLRDLPTG